MNMPSRHTRAGHAHHDSHEHGATAKAGDSLKDPVCGMNVTAQSAHQVEHPGASGLLITCMRNVPLPVPI